MSGSRPSGPLVVFSVMFRQDLLLPYNTSAIYLPINISFCKYNSRNWSVCGNILYT